MGSLRQLRAALRSVTEVLVFLRAVRPRGSTDYPPRPSHLAKPFLSSPCPSLSASCSFLPGEPSRRVSALSRVLFFTGVVQQARGSRSRIEFMPRHTPPPTCAPSRETSSNVVRPAVPVSVCDAPSPGWASVTSEREVKAALLFLGVARALALCVAPYEYAPLYSDLDTRVTHNGEAVLSFVGVVLARGSIATHSLGTPAPTCAPSSGKLLVRASLVPACAALFRPGQ
ncbi:hypothetical protein B0H12DRAFT_1326095 [Mycena haematopus]|nr:hypothetical protein B0H12DRAFT_1326095 [Mycena haematopus]